MNILKEFKEFAARGNVIDLAIGIIVGGAFGKIVSSLVADIIMPSIGLLVGGVNFTGIKLKLKDAVLDASGKIIAEAVTINIGNFVQTIFDFVVVAFAIFMVIKAINKIKKKKEQAVSKPAEANAEQKLLAEIRDLLKDKNK